MFTVYGLTGQVFNGPLEQLHRVHQLARVRSVRPVAQDGGEAGVEALEARPAHQALRAYRSMLPEALERGPLVHATQVMSRPVITVRARDSVAEAWRVLRERGIHQAPVVDDTPQLIGIVSERDLLTAINIEDGRIVETLQRQVRDVMTTPVVAAQPVTDIRRIAAVMLEQGVDGVPIVGEHERLIGFVSRSDVLRAVITDPPLSLWR